jgi:hypothetical protein
MLHRASKLRRDIVPGRWMVVTSHRRRRWLVIVAPEAVEELLVVITAYPSEDG